MARCFASGAVGTASRRGEGPAFVEQLPWLADSSASRPVVEGGENRRTRTGPVAADPSASPAARDLAAAVNGLRRIIISNQPVDLPWDNSELVVARSDDDLIAAVTAIKRRPGRDLGVPGGVRTAQRFARLGLIDEYILRVHPVAIGSGQPLFTQKTELQLIGAKAYDSGVMRLRYQTRSHSPAAT